MPKDKDWDIANDLGDMYDDIKSYAEDVEINYHEMKTRGGHTQKADVNAYFYTENARERAMKKYGDAEIGKIYDSFVAYWTVYLEKGVIVKIVPLED